MENEHTVAGLIRKRAELAGEIDHLHSQVQEKLIQLDHLDAALRIFQPDIKLEELKPKPIPPRESAMPGEMTRAVLTVLRRANQPLTALEIADRVMDLRCMNRNDKALVRTIRKRVTQCVRNNRGKGVLNSRQLTGRHLLWEII
jgi:hypothetical protein